MFPVAAVNIAESPKIVMEAKSQESANNGLRFQENQKKQARVIPNWPGARIPNYISATFPRVTACAQVFERPPSCKEEIGKGKKKKKSKRGRLLKSRRLSIVIHHRLLMRNLSPFMSP